MPPESGQKKVDAPNAFLRLSIAHTVSSVPHLQIPNKNAPFRFNNSEVHYSILIDWDFQGQLLGVHPRHFSTLLAPCKRRLACTIILLLFVFKKAMNISFWKPCIWGPVMAPNCTFGIVFDRIPSHGGWNQWVSEPPLWEFCTQPEEFKAGGMYLTIRSINPHKTLPSVMILLPFPLYPHPPSLRYTCLH